MSRVRFPSPAPKNQHSIECFFYALNPPTTPAARFTKFTVRRRAFVCVMASVSGTPARFTAAVFPRTLFRAFRRSLSDSPPKPCRRILFRVRSERPSRVLQNLPPAAAPYRCAHTLSPDILRNPTRHTRRACRSFYPPISALSSPPLFAVPFPHTKKPRFLGASFFIFQVRIFSCRTFR